MDPLIPRLTELLMAFGPGLLFVMAVLETSFATGLVVPSGLATALATVLALQGDMAVRPLVLAALGGALLGDSLGFWIGRVFGTRVLSGSGPWRERVGRRQRDLGVTLGRHPFFSVTLARLVSFVRTLMPMAAGMSALSYRRFLAYDVAGVLAWGVLYVGIGLLARESWHVATRILGVGGGLALVGVGVFFWFSLRRQGRRPTASTTGEPS